MSDSYESFYEGGQSSFSSEYDNGNFIGFRLGAGEFASTTSPMTSNQISEVVGRIKEGVKNIEVSPVGQGVGGSGLNIDQIPDSQWDEIRAIMKLTGVKPSMHAPILNPAGITQQGFPGEDSRERNERQFKSFVEKAHKMDPSGNIPIVFHAAEGGGARTYAPGEEGEDRFKVTQAAVIDKESGQLTAVQERRIHSLGESDEEMKEGGGLMDVETALRSRNKTNWDAQVHEVLMAKRYAEESLKNLEAENERLMKEKALDKGADVTDENKFTPQDFGEIQQQLKPLVEKTQNFISHADLKFSGVFDSAYKNAASEAQRKEFEKINRKHREDLEKLEEQAKKGKADFSVERSRLIERDLLEMDKLASGINPNTGKRDEGFGAPQQFVDAEDFALEKSAKTFGNTAYHGYKKFGDSAPIIAIENLYPGMAHSRAEDMVDLVKQARKNFVKEAVKDGVDKDMAKEEAEKLIGVTWDVGHLNIGKSAGFTDDDMVEQSKIISPYVKHIHLTDNFGFGDSHLAPGMGNVPVKKILEQLEKNGEFEKMTKVVEASALFAQGGLGLSPHLETMKAFGSLAYGGSGPQISPPAMPMGGYFSGYGFSNPSIHHSIYNSGFSLSTLPISVGGQMPGDKSGFSGTPNA